MRSFRDGADPEAVQQLLVDIGDLLRELQKRAMKTLNIQTILALAVSFLLANALSALACVGWLNPVPERSPMNRRRSRQASHFHGVFSLCSWWFCR